MDIQYLLIAFIKISLDQCIQVVCIQVVCIQVALKQKKFNLNLLYQIVIPIF